VIVDIGAAKANYETVYGHTALAAIAAGVIMFLLAPLLKKLMHGEVAHGEVAHRTVMNGERKH
jgi:dipeptide/tripeptide permease